MATIQIVLEKALLQATNRAARRRRLNRSALVRDALRAYLRRLEVEERERRDRAGYTGKPDTEFAVWDQVTGWPGDTRLVRFPRPDKPRPVLVLTRGSAIGYLSRVTVAPITSSIRDVPSEVLVGPDDGMKHPSAVNLHNVLTIDKSLVGRRVARLEDARMRDVCRALGFARGCDG